MGDKKKLHRDKFEIQTTIDRWSIERSTLDVVEIKRQEMMGRLLAEISGDCAYCVFATFHEYQEVDHLRDATRVGLMASCNASVCVTDVASLSVGVMPMVAPDVASEIEVADEPRVTLRPKRNPLYGTW